MANFVVSQHFSQTACHAEDGHLCGLTTFLTQCAPRRGWPPLWSHNVSNTFRATQRMANFVVSQHFSQIARHAEDGHLCGLTFLTHCASRRGWPPLWPHNVSHTLRATQRMATFVTSQRFSHIARYAEDGHLCGLITFLTHCVPRRRWPPLWPYNVPHILRATQMATFVTSQRNPNIATDKYQQENKLHVPYRKSNATINVWYRVYQPDRTEKRFRSDSALGFTREFCTRNLRPRHIGWNKPYSRIPYRHSIKNPLTVSLIFMARRTFASGYVTGRTIRFVASAFRRETDEKCTLLGY